MGIDKLILVLLIHINTYNRMEKKIYNPNVTDFLLSLSLSIYIYIYIYIYMHGEFNKFPDFFCTASKFFYRHL